MKTSVDLPSPVDDPSFVTIRLLELGETLFIYGLQHTDKRFIRFENHFSKLFYQKNDQFPDIFTKPNCTRCIFIRWISFAEFFVQNENEISSKFRNLWLKIFVRMELIVFKRFSAATMETNDL